MRSNLLYAISLLLFSVELNAQPDVNEISQADRTLYFLENKGQLIDSDNELRPDIRYYSQLKNGTVYLRKNGISYVKYSEVNTVVGDDEKEKETGKSNDLNTELKRKSISVQRIDLNFIGANDSAFFIPQDVASEISNYYFPHCKEGVTGIGSYLTVTSKNIYPGIDVKYQKTESGLKYDFIVKPSADISKIKMQYDGYKNLSIEHGKVLVEGQLGTITESLPKVYQLINGKIVDINAWYEYEDENRDLKKTITIRTATYNKDYELIIDPWATWITFLGGNAGDEGVAVATDVNGNVFITGETQSPNFPVLNGYQMTVVSWVDIFVSKFNSSGNLIWSTYYGGGTYDAPYDLCTDFSGNVIVTGYTNSTNFPVLSGFQMSLAGNNDAFLVKFDASGVRQWASFLGGNDQEFGYGIEADNSGNIYVVGETNSTNFPVLLAFQPSRSSPSEDAFLAKFNSAGTRIWSTYYGGLSADKGRSLTVLPGGDIVFCGETASSNLPTLNAFQPIRSSGTDAFLARFSSSGGLQWATFFGGTGQDYAYDISFDANSNVWISGTTTSSNLPVFAGHQMTYAGLIDAYVAKFNSTGGRVWATYIGGMDHEESYGIAVDQITGVAYLTGRTPGFGFPITSGACQPTVAGLTDHFMTSIGPVGNLICSTYIGGVGYELQDFGHHIALHGGYAYIANYGNANFPVNAGYQMTYGGSTDDAVLAQIPKNCGCSPVFSTLQAQSSTTCFSQCNGTAIVIASGGTAPYSFSWSPSVSTSPVASNLCAGSYTCTVTDINLATSTLVFTISQTPALVTVSSFTSLAPCNNVCNGTATVSVSGGTPTYSYLWNTIPPQLTATATNLCAGNYSVTVTDQIGCTSLQSGTITQPTALIASVSSTSTLCSSPTGTATITASGGTGPYTYSWAPTGGTGAIASNLGAGTYSCIITDANGCSITSTVVITSASGSSVISATNVSCFGQEDGTGNMIVSGGTPPYTYNWQPSGGNAATATALTPGTYTCTAIDNGGCIVSQTISITQPSALVLTITGITDVSCFNACDGSVNWSASGGIPAYQLSALPSGLCGGNHTLILEDAMGCSDTVIISISSPPGPINLIITGEDSICSGDEDTLIALASGGWNSGFLYTWQPGNLINDSLIVNTVSSVSYTCTVIDSSGCSESQSFQILALQAPVVTMNLSQIDTLCFAPGAVTIPASPSGGIYSGTGVNGNQFDPLIAGPGYHVISYVYQNNFGCSNNAIDSIWVDVCSDVKQNDLHPCFRVFPNYIRDYFYYENCFPNTRINLYNVFGELVFTQCVSGSGNANVSDLATGIYLLVVELNNSIAVERMIIGD